MLIRPFGPRRGPGLLRAAARTAVVAGTASAVTGAVRRHQAADYPPPAPSQPVAPQQNAVPADNLIHAGRRRAKPKTWKRSRARLSSAAPSTSTA